MSDYFVTAVLGSPRELIDEVWESEDGPDRDDMRVMQRALLLLTYPTGEQGRPWIDGVFGPHTRRALKQFQGENSLEVTGRFDVPSRAALFARVGERLGSWTPEQCHGARGQLDKVEAMTPFTAERMVFYYTDYAKARVNPEAGASFLALLTWINNATCLPGLELSDYLNRLAEGAAPAQARRLALRVGFFQRPGAFYAEHAEFELERALNFGDLDYQFDLAAALLKSDEKLYRAALERKADALAEAFAMHESACQLGYRLSPSMESRPRGLADLIAEIDAALIAGETPAATVDD